MKKLLNYAFFLVLTFGFVSILPVHAQETTTGLAQLAQCSGPDCTACNVVYLANGLIKWLIGICFILFAVLLTVAGVRLVTSGGNSGSVEEAKSSFLNALIGFIIILSAWLIVDTVMRALVGSPGHPGQLVSNGSKTGYLFWSEVSCQVQVPPQYTGQITINFSPEYTEDSSPVSYTPGQPFVGGANCPAASPSAMVSIPGQTDFVATADTVRRFVLMRTAAAADGITLTVTSAYRSDEKQVEIWKSHGCESKSCSGTVARPCSLGGNGSNHNSGAALDISVGSSGSPTFNWLKANGGQFGFYNNLDARDPLHWSPSGR